MPSKLHLRKLSKKVVQVLHKASSLTHEEDEDEGTSVGAGTLVRVNLSEVRKWLWLIQDMRNSDPRTLWFQARVNQGSSSSYNSYFHLLEWVRFSYRGNNKPQSWEMLNLDSEPLNWCSDDILSMKEGSLFCFVLEHRLMFSLKIIFYFIKLK